MLPHDVRDYDLQLSPILATVAGRDLVIGGGKGGHIFAWDRDTHERVWTQAVGTHRNDVGPLPETPVEVCPGLFGGALTPMAYADGRVFVPVVELCMRESAVTTARVAQRPPEEGTGVVAALDAATGQPLWTRQPAVRAVRLRHGGVRRGLHPDLRRADLRALGRDGGDPLEGPRAGGDQRLSRRSRETRCSCPQAHLTAISQQPVPQLIAYRLASSAIGWMAWNMR